MICLVHEGGWAGLMYMLVLVMIIRKWSVFITCHSCLVHDYFPLANYSNHKLYNFTTKYLMWTVANGYAQVYANFIYM